MSVVKDHWLIPKAGRYPEASRLALEKFDDGIKDGYWKPRQSWVKFIAPQLKDGNEFFPIVTRPNCPVSNW